MSLLCNMMSSFVIAFFLSKKKATLKKFHGCSHRLQWFWSPRKQSLSWFPLFPLFICHEVTKQDAMILVFWMLSFKPDFSLSSLTKELHPRTSLVPLHFLPLEWYLHIWGCWYFSWQSWFQLASHPVCHFARFTRQRSEISRETIYSLDVLLSQFVIPCPVLTVAIKPQHGTYSVHVGYRRPLELREVPHLRHLLEWVLEAQAGKWMQRAPAFHGISLNRKRKEKEWHGETKLQWARSALYFPK